MINVTAIRSHVEANAKSNGGAWDVYDNIALELSDAQFAAAAQKNPTLVQLINSASAAIDFPALDLAIQNFVLRTAEQNGVTYDVYALMG